MMWHRLMIAVLPMVTACVESPTPVDVSLGEEFELAPRESARISTEELTVTFERVSEDSRCPIDVTCIREGDATVRVTVSKPSRDTATLELHTSVVSAREKPYGDYRLTLVSLRPEPRSTTTISPGDYRARLKVTLAGSTT